MAGAAWSPPKTVMKRTYVLRPAADSASTPELHDLSAQHHAAHCKDAVTYFRKARAANERYAEYKRKESENRAKLRARSLPTTAGTRVFQVANAAMVKHRGESAAPGGLFNAFNAGGMSSGLGVSKQPNLLRRLAVK